MRLPFHVSIGKSAGVQDATAGLVAGLLVFALALLTVPQTVRTIREYDILLSIRVGLLYLPIAAFLLRQEKARTAVIMRRRFAGGLILGFAYAWLCSNTSKPMMIMVVLPSILSASLNLLFLLIDGQKLLQIRSLRTCSDGLTAGFVLGLVYSLLLNIGGVCLGYAGFLNFQSLTLEKYVSTIKLGGPCAFGLASGLFFFLRGQMCDKEVKVFNFSMRFEAARLMLVLAVISAMANWKLMLASF